MNKYRRYSLGCPLLAALLALFFACANRISQSPPKPVRISLAVYGPGRITPEISDTLVTIGDTLLLLGIPDEKAVFTGWYGDTFTVSSDLNLIARRSMRIEARFAKQPESDVMVLVGARGRSFRMGNSSPLSPQIERPAQTVEFRYDFYMNKYEITQKEYHTHVPELSQSVQYVVKGDSFPVHNVSFYEAVLFCNALSKAYGYDTVYTYTARCREGQSCPYILENLSIHYDRFGYRLPTEAEWEYACRANSETDYFWGNDSSDASTYAWHFGNSDGVIHPVGLKNPNSWGIHDMAGNIAEWVNDWLSPYSDSARTDPVGPRDLPLETYEQGWERPVRGGSFRTPLIDLRSSTRRIGGYETPAKARLPDIGFRVVLGAFVPGSEVKFNPVVGDTGVFIRHANKSDLLSFLGTSNAKLVFCEFKHPHRTLHLVDFTKADLSAKKIPDSLPVWNPFISPNGKSVAYSSLGEGYRGDSRLTVRGLDSGSRFHAKGFNPRWWVNPAGSDTFLIYADGASINSLPEWINEKTYKQKVSDLGFVGSPEVLWRLGSYHGGLSSDGRFLGTSYTIGRLVDLQIEDTLIYYFDSPYNGRDDRPQICNLSMSPSLVRTGEALLLDFGYSRKSGLIGRPYGLHEFIFRCNSKLLSYDHVERWYQRPAGYRAWNDVEYTNHPDFATAIAESGSENAVFLINLKDSAYLKLGSGPGIRTPYLWIDPVHLAENPDPYYHFGHYDHPVQSTTQIILNRKLKLFWTKRDWVECMVLGSSTFDWGFDVNHIKQLKTLNLSAPGATQYVNAAIVLHYGLNLAPHLKVVCIAFDPGFFRQYPEYPWYIMCGLRDSKGFELDQENQFWINGVPSSIQAKIDSYGPGEWAGYSGTGQRVDSSLGSGWDPIEFFPHEYALQDTLVAQTLRSLEILAKSAAEKNVHLVFVNPPQHPEYGKSPYIGRMGPSNETFRLLEQWVDTVSSNNPFVHYYDAHNYGKHDYRSDEAYDCFHLNARGGAKLASRVDSVITRILER